MDEYITEAEQLLGRLSGDRSVSDRNFVEVCEEIAYMFDASARAKQEELNREG